MNKSNRLCQWPLLFLLFIMILTAAEISQATVTKDAILSRIYYLNSYNQEDNMLFFKAIPFESGPVNSIFRCDNRGYYLEASTEYSFANNKPEYVILASYSENELVKKYVDRQINIYTTKKRRTFAQWLARAGRYLDLIKSILREEGLPEELVYLPLIESGFNTRARSHARAVGPWQFISATAKKYGLKIDYWVDERRDPVKSTRAAARYLKDLYDQFGSWPLALAAYNAGEGRVRRALRKTKTDDYWRIIKTRYLKRETKYYVSKFFAAGIIASDPEKYGFSDIQYHEPIKFEEVTIDKPASLKFIAQCANTTLQHIKELNPELKRWCTPVDVPAYKLRIPEGIKEDFLECFNSAPPNKRMPRVPYIIKKGDTIYEIAKRYGIKRKDIFALNKGINPRRLRPGRILYLPPYK
ncbi:MAG: transglycosylase SLT domain-containing protein [Nitrospirae bacterium]|nr:transglycosylase SLT domain-containing protein [Nitrospirota bacterium]